MSPTIFSKVKFFWSYFLFSVQFFWSMGEFCCRRSTCCRRSYCLETDFIFFKKGKSLMILPMIHLFLMGVFSLRIMGSFIISGLTMFLSHKKNILSISLVFVWLISRIIFIYLLKLIVIKTCGVHSLLFEVHQV